MGRGFNDKDYSKVIFLMKPPYMYDGKGIISKDVQVTLTKVNSEYKLSYIPSEEWLNDKDRVYPVTIDPYIGTPPGVTSIEDSFIGSKIPNETRQITDRLGVGLGSSSGITRSYIRFTLPVLKSGDMIINAQLRLFLFTANSDLRQINVHQVTQDWHSGSIKWDTPAQFNLQKIEDYQIVQGNMHDLITWDVTSIAKDWYNTGNNYGLMLKNEDETVGYNEFVASDTTLDKSGGSLVFLPSGYLHEIKDKNNNTMSLSYNGATLIFITDGAGRVTNLDIIEGIGLIVRLGCTTCRVGIIILSGEGILMQML